MVSSNDSPEQLQREEDPARITSQGFAKQAYKAFQIGTAQRRFIEFRLRFPDPSESVPYGALIKINNEWRAGQGMTLYFSTPMVAIIKGENLTELYQAIENHTLEWLAEFNPTEYEQPEDSTAPYIRSITIHTRLPEEVPSHVKRH